jgi:hypothetical protein
MKMHAWSKPIAGGLAILAGLMVLPTGKAQETDEAVADVLIAAPGIGPPTIERRPLDQPPDVLKLKANAIAVATDGVQKRIVSVHGRPDGMHELREAAAAVNDAEDEKSKRQAQERLEDMLDRYFDSDIRRRERELEDIEQRLKKLEAALERRREKRREIVDLQKQVLLNEADGLGFFSGDHLFIGPGNGFEFKVEPFAAPAMVPHPPAAVIYAPQPPQAPGPPPQLQFRSTEPAPGERDRDRDRDREREQERERERDRENDRDADRDIFE